jgi:hypothetical protein
MKHNRIDDTISAVKYCLNKYGDTTANFELLFIIMIYYLV